MLPTRISYVKPVSGVVGKNFKICVGGKTVVVRVGRAKECIPGNMVYFNPSNREGDGPCVLARCEDGVVVILRRIEGPNAPSLVFEVYDDGKVFGEPDRVSEVRAESIEETEEEPSEVATDFSWRYISG